MELMPANKLKNWWRNMSSGDKELVEGGLLFSRLAYAWLFLLIIFLSPILEDVIGPNGLTYRTSHKPTLVNNILYILAYRPDYYKIIASLTALGALSCWFNLHRKVLDYLGGKIKSTLWQPFSITSGLMFRFLVWVLALIFGFSTYLTFNASIMLELNWLFWLVFFFPNPKSKFEVVLNNWSVLACRIQFLIVYFYSALFKWLEPDWLNGDSIHFLSLIEIFTPEWLGELLQSMPWLLVVLNFLMLFYLTLFPLLIWFKKLKTPLLILGLGFHLYTIFVMGLYDFGSIMIVGYVLFLTKSHLDSIRGLFSRNNRSLFNTSK